MSTAYRLLAMAACASFLAIAAATALGQGHSEAESDLANDLRLATSSEAKLALIKRIRDGPVRSADIARVLGAEIASDNPVVAAAAADTLATQADHAWPVIADALRQKSPSVKVQALRAVAQTEKLPATILAFAAEILGDPEEPMGVRLQAAVTLGGRGGDSLAVVLPLLNADDPVAREFGLDSIRLTGVRSVSLADAVEHAASDKQPRVRAAAAACFAAWGFDADAMAAVLPLLDEADQYVRYRALDVLDIMGKHAGSAVPRLATYLATTRDDGERLRIVVVLGRTGDKRVVEPILGVLKVEPGAVGAVIGLQPAVRFALRRAAFEALQRLGPSAEKAVPALTAILGDEEQRLWWQEVVEVLEAIGPAAKAAVPVLERLAAQEPERLGWICAKALAAIKGD